MTSALKGEDGGPGEADKVRALSKGGCVKLRTSGEGSKAFLQNTDYFQQSPKESKQAWAELCQNKHSLS